MAKAEKGEKVFFMWLKNKELESKKLVTRSVKKEKSVAFCPTLAFAV